MDTGLVRGGRFLAGLIICILYGFLSPLFNIAFAYGSEIQTQAIKYGANPTSAGNAVWLLVANAGFFPSLIYSLYLLNKNRTWNRFRSGTSKYWMLTPGMGLMWISGAVLYGIGANAMGSLGPVIGWPVFLSTTVLVAALWGFFTGEWKGIHGGPLHLQTAGLIPHCGDVHAGLGNQVLMSIELKPKFLARMARRDDRIRRLEYALRPGVARNAAGHRSPKRRYR